MSIINWACLPHVFLCSLISPMYSRTIWSLGAILSVQEIVVTKCATYLYIFTISDIHGKIWGQNSF